MRVFSHDRWRFPLPPGHRFPLAKYGRLRARIEAEAVASVAEADAVSWEELVLMHSPALVERLRHGRLSLRESRGLGLPWSPELIERARRATGGTVAAAREALTAGVGMNLGGGTHHAGRDFARGYCVFNDVAVAAGVLRSAGLARRVLVVDCDVHQGDGTADLLAGDPDAFTLSIHGRRNYPFQRIASDLDVDVDTGAGDDEYLSLLAPALEQALASGPFDIAFYLAGADPWEGDRLGRLSLTKAGLLARDRHVLDRLESEAIPTCITLAGGYADDVEDTVDIHFATTLEAAARVKV